MSNEWVVSLVTDTWSRILRMASSWCLQIWSSAWCNSTTTPAIRAATCPVTPPTAPARRAHPPTPSPHPPGRAAAGAVTCATNRSTFLCKRQCARVTSRTLIANANPGLYFFTRIKCLLRTSSLAH